MAKNNWKQKLGVLGDKGVVREINGKDWKFYPVSVGKLFALRSTISDIVGAFATLFGKDDGDTSQEHEKIIQGEGGGTITRTSVGAISPELAKLRTQQREAGARSAVEALMSDKNKLAIARLLADSLRDDFERDAPDEEVTAFFDELDISDLYEMVMGFVAANTKVFGPLADRIKATLSKKLLELQSVDAGPSASGQPATPSPSEPQS
jgi:hypothetical protein